MAKKLMTLAFGAAALFALTLPFTVLSSAQDKSIQQGDPTQRGQGQGQAQGFPPQGGFQGQGQGPGAAGPGGPGGFQRGGQGGPGGPGGGFGGFGGGGGTAMVEDSNFLYVLMGNRLIKVLKADLKVLGEVQLGGGMPGMPGQGGPGGPGGFGGGGQGGRGGAGGGGQGGQGGQGGGTIPPTK